MDQHLFAVGSISGALIYDLPAMNPVTNLEDADASVLLGVHAHWRMHYCSIGRTVSSVTQHTRPFSNCPESETH